MLRAKEFAKQPEPLLRTIALQGIDRSDLVAFAAHAQDLCAPVNPAAPQFNTVGLPAYLCSGDPSRYTSAFLQMNRVVWERFEFLYRGLCVSLEDEMKEPIFFSANASLPGFHVIKRDAGHGGYQGGMPHIDCSYRNVPAFSTGADDSCHLSFTLLLSEDDSDAGIRFWPLGVSQDEACHQDPSAVHLYEQGVISLFCSDVVHAIAPFGGTRPRVTLQGHLIRIAGRFLAYW